MDKQYAKTTWTDEVPATTPVKYRITEGGSITHEDAVIEVASAITAGTPINAANLNNIEEGIDALDDLLVEVSRETIYLKVIPASTALADGDEQMIFTVPGTVDGMEITAVDIGVYTPSSSGVVSVQLHNLTTAHDILSTNATIDQGEYNSYSADAPAVVNASYKTLTKGQRIRVDVDGAGVGVKGLDVIILAERA